MAGEFQQAADALRAFALGLPEAEEAFPWGERVVKVNKKVFVFFGLMEDLDKRLMITVKLPQTGSYALQMPFVEASGYNLGKHGWVTARIAPGEPVPLDLLVEWIEESYCAVAPKRLVARLTQGRGESTNMPEAR
jgi:predicted DNA-binding protein (MmcQ/YjbR family)